jgi:hypothetical protein
MTNRSPFVLALVAVLALAVAPVVQAQTGVVAQQRESTLFKPWTDRIFINVNGAYFSPLPQDIKTATSFPIYDETATTSSVQTVTFKGSLVDITVGARVIQNFGLGMGYTSSSTIGTGTLSAKTPHPLVYDMPRSASGSLDGLDHFESAFHVMALYVAKLPMNFEVAVSAGPTFFKVQQDTIGSIATGDEVLPYTTITLKTPVVTMVEATKVGLNAGIDVAWFSNLSVSVLSNVGVGVFVKYAGTTVELKPVGVDPIPMKVGGTQYGFGLRLRFKIGNF